MSALDYNPAVRATKRPRVSDGQPWQDDELFPTPPWATRALCRHVLPRLEAADPVTGLYPLSALDPACGEGHMALALREYFPLVTASDVHAYGFGGLGDFLHPSEIYAPRDWVVTNPPFNLGPDFVRRAFAVAKRGVAMLVRTAFLEGEERYRELYARTPPALIAQFVERVPMHRGRWVVNGTSATAYCWLVWHTDRAEGADPAFMWIPKSRQALSRPDDWLRFSGCMDLPRTHPAVKLMEDAGVRRQLTLAELKSHLASRAAGAPAGRPTSADARSGLRPAADGERPAPASIGDIRRELEARLI